MSLLLLLVLDWIVVAVGALDGRFGVVLRQMWDVRIRWVVRVLFSVGEPL
jgi:hypothetical protein